MDTGPINLPDTPAPAAMAAADGTYINGAPKKISGLATPSRIRQALLESIASSPSLVTAADLPQPSPLHGKYGNGNANSTNGLKRPRTEDHANLEEASRDLEVRSALDKDRRLYEAKMKMFQDCADAIDKTLQKAGTELYPYAKDFSTFFAGCLNEWLGSRRSDPRTAENSRTEENPEKLTYARIARSPMADQPTGPRRDQAGSDSKKTPSTAKTLPLTRTTSKDFRIFVRMDNTRLEPFGVKSTLVRRLGLDLRELREVTRCATGFALHPNDEATQRKLLAYRAEILDILKAKAVEKHVVWHHYKIKGRPRKVMSAEGLTIDITEGIVANETEAQTGVRPVKCALSKNTSDNDIETTWMVSFTEEIIKPFRLFAHSINSSRSHRDPKVTQCERCLGFHGKNYRCERKICPNCAGNTHEGTCQKLVPKCVNCSGPHAATSKECPARPKLKGGRIRKPTIDQLREIRLAGERARSYAYNEAKKGVGKKETNRMEAVVENENSQRAQSETSSTTAIEVDTPDPAGEKSQPGKDADTIVVCQ